MQIDGTRREILMLQPTHTRNGHHVSEPRAAILEANSQGATVRLGGGPLGPAALWEASRRALQPGQRVKIEYSRGAVERIRRAAELLDKLVAAEEPVYGINTGFGFFANVVIPRDKLAALQKNIVRSHCSGVGELLPRDIVMAMWLIGLNTICRGHSGVQLQTLDKITRILEAGVLAQVPSQGSVGASGDLAPGARCGACAVGRGRLHGAGRRHVRQNAGQ